MVCSLYLHGIVIWYFYLFIYLFIYSYVLDWLKSLFSFSCKIRDAFFTFSNNFIDLDILSMSVIVHVENVDCSQLMS